MVETPKVLCFQINDYDDLSYCPLIFLKDHYFFRGQANAEWGLKTSLERKYDAYREESLKIGQQENNIAEDEKKYFTKAFSLAFGYKEENAAIETFRRLTSLSGDLKSIEILARMQHYGAATRLLDVTTSFLIALFFAFEDYGDQDRAVWVFNSSYFYKRSGLINKTVHFDLENEKREAFQKLISDKDKLYNESIKEACRYIGNPPHSEHKPPSIIPLEITGNNPRLIAQNGAFLFPTNLKKPFKENLCSVLDMGVDEFHFACEKMQCGGIRDEVASNIVNAAIIKLIFPVKIRHLVERLFNAANISCQSIYPDAIGVAKSIKYW